MSIISRAPSWFRLLQISIGIVSIVLSILSMLYPGITVLTMIVFISIILIIIGIERVVTGMLGSIPLQSVYIQRSSRYANIGLGILAIAFGIIAITFPDFASGFLVAIVAFGLLFYGVAKVLHGIVLHKGRIEYASSTWHRISQIAIGSLSIALSVFAIASPTFGIVFLSLLISIPLLVIGIEMAVVGFTGRRLKDQSLT
ncbi:MAG: DUF308 domain-containing protein [Thermoproteota archaeon]|nr:DUF308 domain-containing protein [Thermoproteota archaeon]